MFLCWCLSLVALIPLTTSTNPGVKVKLTAKGIEYGRQLAVASILQKLKTIKLDDMSGKVKVSPIGNVKYSLTKKDSGSFNLNANDISFSTSLSIKSDQTGRPVVNSLDCGANVGKMSVHFKGGASWLYNLFSKYIDSAIRKAMQKQICPLVANAVSDLNNNLKTLNVLAKVDKFAEIEYSMVASPAVSKTSIDFGLKGEFYNIGNFSLPPQVNNMLYIGVSSFTTESAAFVYNTAGALSLYITDDMIPQGSPIRLNTRTFGLFIPQVAKRFPGLMMKLLVKTVKTPFITFEPNNATVQTFASVTAYAIQPNATLTPLFVLNLDSSVSARVFVSGTRLAGAVTLNKMDLTLGTSYVGDFQVSSLDSIFQMVLKMVVIPRMNVQLAKGYPLPTLGKMKLVNTQLLVLKDYVMIGTDVQFTG
ncbi:Bactericidal permeability-increasing protein [Dissostichus eleginoides]|uniref:Bactericidal permeability-increasing protein n=1 Tax=Dissostichus eleginoides TaxID=100907 RepID=A0AAD9FCN7_DISEL|nr:Bactericidal permeability-increasing protein [Dissostichus eleginoides]